MGRSKGSQFVRFFKPIMEVLKKWGDLEQRLR